MARTRQPLLPSPDDPRVQVELVAISGVVEGARVRLAADEALLLGRTNKGMQLADPLASLQHAVIHWDDDGWVIEDLGSVSGTYVGGVKVGNVPQRIVPGDVIRIGETELELVQLHQSAKIAARTLVGGFLALVLFALIAFMLVPRNEADVSLLWTDPIERGDLRMATRELTLPRDFQRSHGLTTRDVRIRRVTDFDNNGRDEVWLRYETTEFVITFSESGEFMVIGEIPDVCPDAGRSLDGQLDLDFPALKCPGIAYEMIGGSYRPSHQDGVVVWTRPKNDDTEEPDAEEPGAEGDSPPLVHDVPVVPYRVVVRRIETLAGFLAVRGIDQPVHYVLCDGAIPGVEAQLLTEKGKQKWLSRGCMSGPHLVGNDLGDVAAIAFTAAGRDALINDITNWFAGNTDGIYLPEYWEPLIDDWTANPGYLLGGTRLEFRDAEHYFRPVAKEGPIRGKVDRTLLSMRHANEAAPKAYTTTLVGAGEMTLDPPGCHELRVNVQPWRCLLSQGCFASRAFVTIKDVGCGAEVDVLTATYEGGQHDGTSGPLQVRAVIESTSSGERAEVTRARISYRLLAPAE